MAWIYLSDDYYDDEKISGLSDGAFRLWHEGLAYAKHYQTDGVIPFAVLRKMRAFTKGRERQLSTPVRDGIAPLWRLVPALGYIIHNYLDWNRSKEEENKEKSDSAGRMRKFRSSLQRNASVSDDATNGATAGVTNGAVLGRGRGESICSSLEREFEGKPLPLSARSKHPIFGGQRFTVFEWQLEGLQRLLGPHFETFDVHAWFFDLDERVVKTSQLVPQRDNGAWLLAQTQVEAQRRGLVMSTAVTSNPQADEAAYQAKLKAHADNVLVLLKRDEAQRAAQMVKDGLR